MPVLVEIVTEAEVLAYRRGALDARRRDEIRDAARFDERLAALIAADPAEDGSDIRNRPTH